MSFPEHIIVHNEDASSPTVSEEIISPVTTDSMVTVPLSDRQSVSEPASTEVDTPTTPGEGKEGQEYFIEAEKETDLTPKTEAACRADEISTETQSVTPVGKDCTQEGYESATSAESDRGVDWEKLDKSEEQEPRTEASHEVRIAGVHTLTSSH
jgi:hypothetical protein